MCMLALDRFCPNFKHRSVLYSGKNKLSKYKKFGWEMLSKYFLGLGRTMYTLFFSKHFSAAADLLFSCFL
jgi:hypothetical protein